MEFESIMGWEEVAATLLWRLGVEPSPITEDQGPGHVWLQKDDQRWDLLDAASTLLDRIERLERLVGSGE